MQQRSQENSGPEWAKSSLPQRTGDVIQGEPEPLPGHGHATSPGPGRLTSVFILPSPKDLLPNQQNHTVGREWCPVELAQMLSVPYLY
jgi:hypothetical protein